MSRFRSTDSHATTDDGQPSGSSYSRSSHSSDSPVVKIVTLIGALAMSWMVLNDERIEWRWGLGAAMSLWACLLLPARVVENVVGMLTTRFTRGHEGSGPRSLPAGGRSQDHGSSGAPSYPQRSASVFAPTGYHYVTTCRVHTPPQPSSCAECRRGFLACIRHQRVNCLECR